MFKLTTTAFETEFHERLHRLAVCKIAGMPHDKEVVGSFPAAANSLIIEPEEQKTYLFAVSSTKKINCSKKKGALTLQRKSFLSSLQFHNSALLRICFHIKQE